MTWPEAFMVVGCSFAVALGIVGIFWAVSKF